MQRQETTPKGSNGSGHARKSKNEATGYESGQGDSIKVYVRVRPPDASHFSGTDVDQNICLEVSSPTALILQCKPEPKVFTYDHVADNNTTQEEVFGAVGKRIVEGCVEGYNGTIFAYGQTGSGKTFTMLGPSDDDSFTHELRGIIPRSFEYLFSLMNREKEKQGDKIEFLCRCSFLEIYNEQIYDLLDAASSGLHLREDIKRGVFVDGLLEKDVASAKDAYSVLNSGWLNRRVASTSMNRESSRSHAVFTVTVESKEKKGGMNNIKVSQLHLVDLAGSERQRDTHAEGVRLKEAASINRSLSALGNVIMALVDITHGKQRHVHYRDSKLTFLLRDSLGGNARTYIIGNVHPSAKCFGETLSTLQFARRAKMIKNKAVLNEDSTGSISSLQAEIRRLRSELEEARAGMTSQISSKGSSTEEGSIDVSSRHCTCASSDGNNNSGGTNVDVEKYKEWKEMMLSAISSRDRAEQEKQVFSEKVQKLEELCSKKEKFLQSTKMILKFRENHISKMESKLRNKDGRESMFDNDRDKDMQLLQDEIKILKDKIEHHPDVTRFAMENLELRAELKRIRNLDPLNNDLATDLARSHRYTLQLEKQLRDYLQSPQGSELEKSLSSSIQSLEASTAELEKSKHEIVQLQSQVESVKIEREEKREELQQAKEKEVEIGEVFRKKQLQYESELAASKKAVAELERSLEALQLKTAVERTTLNDIHMQTIRTLATPKKMTPNKLNTTPRSSSNTPRIRTPGRLNSSIINLSDEKPPLNMLRRKDSFNDSGSDSEFDEPFFNFESDSKDAEELYSEALMDELKKSQDTNNSLLQKLQNEEANRIKLNQVNSKLEFQVNHLQDFINSERDKWAAIETDLNMKVLSLSEHKKDTKNEVTMLRSENEDLKIILQATDRKVVSLKKEKDLENIDTGRKIASLEGKLVRLEIEHHNQQSEMESTIEQNQQLQSDNETLRDEVEFKNFRIDELQELLTKEREKMKTLEQEFQSVIDKLEIQTETNIKLLAHADKEQELVGALEQCATLRNDLQQSNALCEQQSNKIKSLTRELDMNKSSLSLVNKQNASDKEYMKGLRTAVQELKSAVTDKEGDIASLQSQLEETKSQHQDLLDALEEKKAQVNKQKDKLKLEAEKYNDDRELYEAKISNLQDELLHTADQCRELTLAFEQEQNQLVSLQFKLKTKGETIQDLESQLTDQEQIMESTKEQYESRIVELQNLAKSNDKIIFIESQATELEECKAKNTQFSRLVEELEYCQQEKNKELAEYKQRILELDAIIHERDMLQTELRRLKYEIEAQQVEAKERDVVNGFELQNVKDQANKAFESCVIANNEKELAIIEKEKLENELVTMTAKMEVALDDAREMSEELERISNIESKQFDEKEELRSQIERMNEEKTRWVKEVEELMKKNFVLTNDLANISGHCNSKQKIQIHEKLKKEINDMKRENHALKEEIARLHIEQEKDLVRESPYSVLRIRSNSMTNKKKNGSENDTSENKENQSELPA